MNDYDLRCPVCDRRCRNRTDLADHQVEHEAKFFRARIAKAGPFVGVRVFFGPPLVDGEQLDRSPRLQAVVGPETTARAVLMLANDGVPAEVDGITLRNVEPIAEHTYRFMIVHEEWAQDVPGHPKASPRKAVDFNSLLPF